MLRVAGVLMVSVVSAVAVLMVRVAAGKAVAMVSAAAATHPRSKV